MVLSRLRPEIPAEAFPRQLESASCGKLKLSLNYLVLKNDGFEFVNEDCLMPGDEIKARFLQYKAEHQSYAVSLTPPNRGSIDPGAWVSTFESCFTKFSQGWRRILDEQPKKIGKLLRRYGEESLTGRDFISTLVLKNLIISADSSVHLVFEPVLPFDSLNLNVSISRYGRIADAHFDG